MNTLWNVTKAIFTITGGYVWVKAIVEVIKEGKEEPEPIVRPVMFPR